jgi:predicted dehydrogenase
MINWGIIGLGNMANVFINCLEDLTNTKVLAIASKSTNKLKLYANRLSITANHCFNDYSQLLDCALIDAVYITLPNNFHYRYIDEALNKGKYVLVEKPAFISVNEANIISQKMNGGDKNFFEGFSYLHSKVTIDLINQIQRKIIGELLDIDMQLGYCIIPRLNHFRKMLDRFKTQHRLFKKNMGGGCILDLGCYLISFLQLLVNLDKYAVLNKQLTYDSKDVEVDAKITIKTDEGVKTKLHCSFKEDLESRVLIKGTYGDILIRNLWSGIRTTVHLNNRLINESGNEEKHFSTQILYINNFIINNGFSSNSNLYNSFSSVKNIKFIEVWKS